LATSVATGDHPATFRRPVISDFVSIPNQFRIIILTLTFAARVGKSPYFSLAIRRKILAGRPAWLAEASPEGRADKNLSALLPLLAGSVEHPPSRSSRTKDLFYEPTSADGPRCRNFERSHELQFLREESA